MEKLAEPVLFDDSGRHVDMTEIIENLYIGTQWVLSCPGHVDGCWSKFSSSIPFVRGAAKNTFYLKKVGWRTYNPFAPCSWVDPPEWPPCVTNSITDNSLCDPPVWPTSLTNLSDPLSNNCVCPKGGGDPCSQHCGGTTKRNCRYQREVLQVSWSRISFIQFNMQTLGIPVTARLYGFR